MKVRIAYGNVIAKARKERGWTIKEAAGRAYVSCGYLHEVEHGKKDASSEYLGAILSSLEIPPAEFFTRVAREYQTKVAA